MSISVKQKESTQNMKFVRTAYYEYINLKYVTRIFFETEKDEDYDECYAIYLEVNEEDILFGYVLDEDWVYEIIEQMIDNVHITNEYLTKEDMYNLLYERTKHEVIT